MGLRRAEAVDRANPMNMTRRPTAVERAYDLARSGECGGVTEIRVKLKSEGYDDAIGWVSGRTMINALRRLCKAAKG